MCIEFSVGRNAANRADDVKTVQILLNMNLYRLTPFRAVPETGSIDSTTLDAIDAFFKKVMSENDAFRGVPFRVPSRPDGNLEPGSDALAELRDGAEAGFTEAGLQLIFIHAGTTRVRAFYDPMSRCMSNYGIRSPLEVAHFLAQVGHECMELRFTEELASGAAYEGRAELGNTQPGDGMRFKGRGLIQLTGRFNYTAYGNAIGRNLLTDAGARTVSTDPSLAVGVAGWFWSTHNLNALAAIDDVLGVTQVVNGGHRGIADRQRILRRAKFLLVERQFVRA